MKASILIRDEIIVSDASVRMKIFAVWPGIEGPHRCDKPEAIGGGDIASTPFLGQWQGGLIIDQASIRTGEGFRADVVLLDPVEASADKSRMLVMFNRPQTDVAGLTGQRRRHVDR